MRRARRLAIVAFSLVPLPAAAQGFNAETIRPGPSTSAGLSQETGRVLPAGDLNVGLTLGYAHNTLVVRDPATNAIIPNGALVANRVTGQLGAAFGVAGILEVRLRVPVVLYETGNLETLRPGSTLGTTVLGDVSVGAKAALVGRPNQDGFKLALLADVDLPTGSAANFAGDDAVSVRPRLVAGLDKDRLSVAVNGGYAVRPKRAVPTASFTMDDQILGGLALAIAIVPRGFWALGEAQVARILGSNGGTRDTGAEALAGVRAAVGPWMVQAGAGVGITAGVGTPDVRGLLAFAYAPDLGRAPIAPTPPPPPPPPVEQAPPDSDKDGITDARDKCRNDPEDKDGFEDEDGCPEPDNDNDEITDPTDKCPNDPEDKDMFEDEDGCPDLDNDKDGVADAADRCPKEAEVMNGVEDDDGCPDKALIELKGNELETLTPILFQSDRKRVRHAFYPALDNIAAFLKAHPEIGRCAVEGHTDDQGPAEWNQTLSLDRAKMVASYLVEKGVDPSRVTAIGQGDKLPWASNRSEEGRAANRRVIFHIEGMSEEQKRKHLEIQKERALKQTGAKENAKEKDKAKEGKRDK
jgi:large repetitive protein